MNCDASQSTPSSTRSTRVRRCRTCSKCTSLTRRIQRIQTEYEYLRAFFLRPVEAPVTRFRGVLTEDRVMCEEIEQLKITLDTLIRSQLFELE